MFGVQSQEEVEKICRAEGSPTPQWVGPNNNTFFQTWTDEAVQRHPVTGETVWFNHAQGLYTTFTFTY